MASLSSTEECLDINLSRTSLVLYVFLSKHRLYDVKSLPVFAYKVR